MQQVPIYVTSIVIAIVMLGISALHAKCIAFRPDNSDVKSRKVKFWLYAFVTLVVNFIVCFATFYMVEKTKSKKDAALIATAIGSALSVVLYIVLGFVTAKINKHGKIGNWF